MATRWRHLIAHRTLRHAAASLHAAENHRAACIA